MSCVRTVALSLLVLLSLCCAAGATEAPERPVSQPVGVPMTPMVSLETWDLHLDLMAGPVLSSSEPPWAFVGRLRTGVLMVRGVTYWQIGATLALSTWQAPSLGVQAEVMHGPSGGWAQLEGFADIEGQPGAALGAGWSVFGLEGQVRGAHPQEMTWTLLLKIHLPLRLFFPLPFERPAEGAPPQ